MWDLFFLYIILRNLTTACRVPLYARSGSTRELPWDHFETPQSHTHVPGDRKIRQSLKKRQYSKLWSHSGPCHNVSPAELILCFTCIQQTDTQRSRTVSMDLVQQHLGSSSGPRGFTFLALWFDTMGVDSAICVLIAVVTPVKFHVSPRAVTSEVD